jgi:hypothetical protein
MDLDELVKYIEKSSQDKKKQGAAVKQAAGTVTPTTMMTMVSSQTVKK